MEKRFIEIPSGMIVNPDVTLFIQDPENSYHAGQRFSRTATSNNCYEYILARVSLFECVLINLEDGNRWSQPVNVKDPAHISREEFNRLCGKMHAFILIS